MREGHSWDQAVGVVARGELLWMLRDWEVEEGRGLCKECD